MHSSKNNVYLISLGCAKNLVDSENMLGLLKERGFPIVSRMEEAGIAVINTCGFIQPAVEECVDTIFECIDQKRRGNLERVFVTGCFVQRYGYRLQREIPEIDGWAGTGEIGKIADLLERGNPGTKPFFIGRPTFLADHMPSRVQTTPFYTAFLKIGEGCSHTCSFCYIPALRGGMRSRDMESIVAEAQDMIDRGVKEINLVSQDTSEYGKDLHRDLCLEDLLERLLILRGLQWIRILYSNPSGVSDRLLKLMANEDVLCPYLDIPIQHVNGGILHSMGRSSMSADPMDLIERIKSVKRAISIRTTLMVGFPGETEDIFEELLDFIEKAEIDHLGAFAFSPEKGTRAARLKDIPPKGIVDLRRDRLMRFQAAIAKKKNHTFIGRTMPVLIEGVSDETDLLLKGRTARMAPEVDGQVLINRGRGRVGEIMPVLIKEAYSYDLIGEII